MRQKTWLVAILLSDFLACKDNPPSNASQFTVAGFTDP